MRYISMIEHLGKKAGLTFEETISFCKRTIISLAVKEKNPDGVVHLSCEACWHKNKMPSYQIEGSLCSALRNTKLDVLSEYVRFPHSVWSLELPMDENAIVDPASGKRLEAVLVGAMIGDVYFTGEGLESLSGGGGAFCHVKEPTGEPSWTTVIVQQWEGEKDIGAPWLSLRHKKGETVAEALRLANKVPFRETALSINDGGVRPTAETGEAILRVCLGAAMFAVGANAKFVSRVPESRSKRRRRELCEKKKRKVNIEDLESTTYRLGSAIQLPNRGGGGGGRPNPEGGGLQFSHLRQGHLRLTRVGRRGEEKYVLKYIHPTVVRPDLGFAKGYVAAKHNLKKPGGANS